MSKRLFVTVSFFASVALAKAVPLFDQPVAEVHLTTGEVLYDAQAKGFNSTSVMVKYRDGAKTVPYDQFPAEWKTLVLARKPQPRATATTKVTSDVVTTEKPKKVALPDRLPGERFKGLSLLSSSADGAFGCMQTEIYNDTDETVSLEPGTLQAELDNGKIVNGRRWIETEDGKISVTLKSTQELPARTTTALKVGFSVPPGVAVTRVTWSKN